MKILTFADVADVGNGKCSALVLQDWEEFAINAGIADCVGNVDTMYPVLGMTIEEGLTELKIPWLVNATGFVGKGLKPPEVRESLVKPATSEPAPWVILITAEPSSPSTWISTVTCAWKGELIVPCERFSRDGLGDSGIFVSARFVSGWEKLCSTRRLRIRTERSIIVKERE